MTELDIFVDRELASVTISVPRDESLLRANDAESTLTFGKLMADELTAFEELAAKLVAIRAELVPG